MVGRCGRVDGDHSHYELKNTSNYTHQKPGISFVGHALASAQPGFSSETVQLRTRYFFTPGDG